MMDQVEFDERMENERRLAGEWGADKDGNLYGSAEYQEPERTYLVYEERVWAGWIANGKFDTDDATVLVACDNLEEAKGYIKEHFPGSVMLSYADEDGLLTDQQFEYYDNGEER